MIWLIAPHQQVLVQIAQVWRQLVSNKVCIYGLIVVFDMDHIFRLRLQIVIKSYV